MRLKRTDGAHIPATHGVPGLTFRVAVNEIFTLKMAVLAPFMTRVGRLVVVVAAGGRRLRKKPRKTIVRAPLIAERDSRRGQV